MKNIDSQNKISIKVVLSGENRFVFSTLLSKAF